MEEDRQGWIAPEIVSCNVRVDRKMEEESRCTNGTIIMEIEKRGIMYARHGREMNA